MTTKKIMSVMWPAFLAACALEMVVFGLFDPFESSLLGRFVGVSRQTAYTLGFGLFWLITTASSALSVWMTTSASSADD
jgi:hypothetical protein